jgi:hypothetical protein
LERGSDLPPRRIGAKLLDAENLQAELTGRNYSDESIGKILGGNMVRVLRSVLCQNWQVTKRQDSTECCPKEIFAKS